MASYTQSPDSSFKARVTTFGGSRGFSGSATASANIFLLAVLGVYAVLFFEQFRHGLEYDESYIISVVSNLASGNGYVGDGVSFYSNSQYFDPQISTGPTLLLPGVIAWWIFNGSIDFVRVVPLSFFVLLLVALNSLLNPTRLSWVRAAVLASPLLMTVGILDLTTRSLVPGRFLGEIAALACLALGSTLLARGKFALGGLIAGLSITAKLHFIVPVATLIAVAGIVMLLRGEPRRIRRLAITAVLAVIPLAVFELSKVFVLGLNGYADHLSTVRAWAQIQSRDTAELIERIPFRIDLLFSLLSGWTLVWLGVLVLLLAVSLPKLRETIHILAHESAPERLGAIMGYAISSISLLAWWLLASAQDSPRQAIPTVLIWTSLLAAVVAHVAVRRPRQSPSQSTKPTWLSTMVVATAFITIISQGARIATNDSGYELALDQEQTASLIQANGEWWVPQEGFWTNPEYLLLTGLDSAPSPGASGLRLWSSVRALTETGIADARRASADCADPLRSSAHAVLCRESQANAPLDIPVELGALDFAQMPGLFTAGWNPPEPWGVWSSGQFASLTIPVKTSGQRKLTVTLKGQPFGREGDVARVVVKADGKPAGSWLLPSATQPSSSQHMQFEVAVPIGLDAWAMDLEIQTPDATAPLDIGIPVEMGEMGLGLTSVEIGPGPA